MKGKSCWSEKSEEEIYQMLLNTFGETDIQTNPKVDAKKADFLVKSIGTYIEVYAVKDITSDIINEFPRSTNVVLVQIPKEKILDRLSRKILHECEQFPEDAPNILVVKTEELYVSAGDVVDVFMEPSLIVNRETMETIGIAYKSHFRTENEAEKAFQKISALIAYERLCKHEKLVGIFADNKNNAKVPLNEKERDLFKEMICDKCM